MSVRGRQITEGQWLRSRCGHQNRKISLAVPQGQGEADLGGEGRKWPFLNEVCTPSLALFISEVIAVIGGEDHESKAHVGRLQQS